MKIKAFWFIADRKSQLASLWNLTDTERGLPAEEQKTAEKRGNDFQEYFHG